MTDENAAKRKAIGQRLRRARSEHHKSAREAIAALRKRWGDTVISTYYSHEAGARMPSDSDLERYAEQFGVSVAYLRYGDYSERFDGAKIPVNKDESDASADGVNQAREQIDLKSSHKPSVRLILLLSADQIRELSTGRGDLAKMSGHTLPVPDFLDASRHSFAFIIPKNDLSMVNPAGETFPPGSWIIADPKRPILPGDLVFADLDEFGPVLRRYVGAKAHAPGARFELHAANPAYRPIAVEPKDLLLIGRVINSGRNH